MTEERLFIGLYPAGIVYADRGATENGDYRRCGFLPYDTLVLEVTKWAGSLRQEIEAHAETIQRRRGEAFEVSSCGQTVRLGSRWNADTARMRVGGTLGS